MRSRSKVYWWFQYERKGSSTGSPRSRICLFPLVYGILKWFFFAFQISIVRQILIKWNIIHKKYCKIEFVRFLMLKFLHNFIWNVRSACKKIFFKSSVQIFYGLTKKRAVFSEILIKWNSFLVCVCSCRVHVYVYVYISLSVFLRWVRYCFHTHTPKKKVPRASFVLIWHSVFTNSKVAQLSPVVVSTKHTNIHVHLFIYQPNKSPYLLHIFSTPNWIMCPCSYFLLDLWLKIKKS